MSDEAVVNPVDLQDEEESSDNETEIVEDKSDDTESGAESEVEDKSDETESGTESDMDSYESHRDSSHICVICVECGFCVDHSDCECDSCEDDSDCEEYSSTQSYIWY